MPASTKSKRQAVAARKRSQKKRATWIWGLVSLGVIAVIGLLVWNASRPYLGESVPIPPGYQNHIPTGTDPGPYTSDPPAGGLHFPETFPAKFYDETDLSTVPPYPQGYLVHDLEHGYVIFWYNCDLLDTQGCTRLKDDIKAVMAEIDNYKVIAFPWKTIDVPVVMTSWGRLYKMENFSASQAREFIQNNQNRSPEPEAQ